MKAKTMLDVVFQYSQSYTRQRQYGITNLLGWADDMLRAIIDFQ